MTQNKHAIKSVPDNEYCLFCYLTWCFHFASIADKICSIDNTNTWNQAIQSDQLHRQWKKHGWNSFRTNLVISLAFFFIILVLRSTNTFCLHWFPFTRWHFVWFGADNLNYCRIILISHDGLNPGAMQTVGHWPYAVLLVAFVWRLYEFCCEIRSL